MASLLDFKKWFYSCKKSDSIVCDRTKLIKSIIEKHDNTVRKAMLMMPIIGIWWTSSKLTWKWLKYVYGSLSSKNDSLEGMLTKLEIRKAVCCHPIEWDKNQFSSLDEKTVGTTVKKRLENEAAAIDLWNGGLDKIFPDSPYFYHPIYFINHLEKAGLFEFNPYENQSFTYEWGYLNQNKEKENRTQSVISNPGFVPGKFNENEFIPCKPNGLFRERYPSKNTANPYPHEGVDFEAIWGTDIVATIHGQVIHIGDQMDIHYGKHILILSDDGFIFLLGHLSIVEVSLGQYVTPKTVVARVGNSGNCYTDGHKVTPAERAAKLGAHLHLSVYKATDFEEIWDFQTTNYIYSNKLRNPFERNHRWDIDGDF